MYRKILSKCIKFLQDSTTAEQIPHNHLLGYLRMLAQYTVSGKLNIASICGSVVDGIIGPYLQIVQKSAETSPLQLLSKTYCRSFPVAQVCVVQYLSS